MDEIPVLLPGWFELGTEQPAALNPLAGPPPVLTSRRRKRTLVPSSIQ